MLKYATRRLLQTLPVLLLISILVFALNDFLPGDLAQAVLGEELARDDEAYARVRADLHLDDPMPVRYVRWLGDAVRGDFGISQRNKEEVSSGLASRAPRTLQLAAMAMLLSLAIAIPVGILSAIRPNSKLDAGGTVFAMLGVAIPDFWLGLMLIFFFAFVVHLFPGTGYMSPTEDLTRNLKLMVLPALTLGMSGTASLMRQTRSSVLEVLQQDYIRTARAKGLQEQVVIVRHTLKNAFLPVVTIFGLQVGRIMGGSVVVETVFGIPGMGKWAADSIFFRDYSPIQAIVLIMAATVIAANLLTDMVYSYLDPRIRLE